MSPTLSPRRVACRPTHASKPPTMPKPRPEFPASGAPPRAVAPSRAPAVLAIVVVVAFLATLVAWRITHRDAGAPAAGAPAVPIEQPRPGTSGWVDGPPGDTAVGPIVRFDGWALDLTGIRRVEIRAGTSVFEARHGIARGDIAAVRPGYPASANAGWEFQGDFSALIGQAGGGRLIAEVVAINGEGVPTPLGRRTIVAPADSSPWKSLWEKRANRGAKPFYIVPGLSGVGLGGAEELSTGYTAYKSPTFDAGMRVPILYMRTTLGEKHDWRFDPDWNIERRCGERRIAEDTLGRVVAYARANRLPVLFTLNGGVWADATCDVPAWDLTDHLEKDAANVQWNERGEAMPDDALKNLPGAQASPELARMLTYNVYAERNRHYKRRNLQEAAKRVVEFARADPDLFIGVNLDPDTTMNPFFEGHQWYDYNPGTIRQFRHWLAGTGPYAGDGGPGVPDLSAYRRARALTLDEVNRYAGRNYTSWDQVDPPRHHQDDSDHRLDAFWNDPWHHEWEVFRRHVIDLHYDELSAWLVEVGVPASRIFSSQGFMAPHDRVQPFAVRVTSPTKNYDSGGVSVEGAVPRHGHLGAVVYGPAAYNDIPMETRDSLYATFHRFDPGWAIVEFNTADLRIPKRLPFYGEAYRAYRDAFNFGARFISPMAWNGSNGIYAGQPGYVSYMAWRNTPAEDALRDFALARAYVPLGTRLWTFGTSVFASDDGWTAAAGATAGAGNGRLVLRSAGARAVLLSPDRLAIRRGETDLLVLGAERPEALAAIGVEVKDGRGAWTVVAAPRPADRYERDPAGLLVPLEWPAGVETAEHLRITLRFATPRIDTTLRRIALYPTREAAAR